jgi:hypothetical protein
MDCVAKINENLKDPRGGFLKMELMRSSKFERILGHSVIEKFLKYCANELA